MLQDTKRFRDKRGIGMGKAVIGIDTRFGSKSKAKFEILLIIPPLVRYVWRIAHDHIKGT